jgi:hypothetical protein
MYPSPASFSSRPSVHSKSIQWPLSEAAVELINNYSFGIAAEIF